MALHQAVKDAASDALVLLVASHPDDRYVLPAVWLRSTYGIRVAVLLATRGGGGQNSMGPETGDRLERIRTLETEAGCAQFEGEVWYLNLRDGGYRRSAEETFAEWGREETLHDLVRLLRTIRPDAVVSTHQAEESHGHDLALVTLLPEAIRQAADSSYPAPGAPCSVRTFLLGARSTITPNTLRIDADRLDETRGSTLRRTAYEILRKWHTSPGPPGPIEDVFEPELKLESQMGPVALDERRPLGLPSLLDEGVWPGSRERAAAIEGFLTRDLPARIAQRDPPAAEVKELVLELRELLAARTAAATTGPDDVASRLRRRIDALEQVLLLLAGLQIELDVPRGAMAVAGEEFVVTVHVHTVRPQQVELRAEGLDGLSVDLAAANGREATEAESGYRADVTIRIPLDVPHEDPMQHRFRGDRFVPPVRIRFFVRVFEVEVPVVVTVPVEQRAAVELDIRPRMLLLPSGRHTLQFSVGVVRHTQFPVDGWLEVKAPAGYAIKQDRQHVLLQNQRGDLFWFTVSAPPDRKPGVDVLRVRLGDNKIALPVHKIDVRTPASLRVGLLRTRDDTLVGILGVGGLGLALSELSDADIAVADLRTFDSIVVDIRALRDRPEARRGFRRLLEFAKGRGKRLVVFYHKDVEFDPPGEGFLGAPFEFHVGKSRVTRADAPVRILKPDHALLTHPNVILPSDWDGWDQERALYLPSVYASEFEEILEMQDPGQPPERSALLYARTEEGGEYVYCALALWRQLKKLHPGAVRILANLLSPTTR